MSSLTFYTAISEKSKISRAVSEMKTALEAGVPEETHKKMVAAIEALAEAVKNQADLWGDMKNSLRDL